MTLDEKPHLSLVRGTGAQPTGWRDRQYPKGLRAVEARDGWRVGMWIENYGRFVPFGDPVSTLAQAETQIEMLRKADFRPVYPPLHMARGGGHG